MIGLVVSKPEKLKLNNGFFLSYYCRSVKSKKKADKSADVEAGKTKARETPENTTIIDSASNGTNETSEHHADEAKSTEKAEKPSEETSPEEADLSREKVENTCEPSPLVLAEDEEFIGEDFKRQASPRDSAAAAPAADGDLGRVENGENWPLTVTDSDAANATNEATQKEKSATAATDEEAGGEGAEKHGRGHIATDREEERQEHDSGGGGGVEGGLESFDDDVGQVKRLIEAESIPAGKSGRSQAARTTPERGELSRGTIGGENEGATAAPLTKRLLGGEGDVAGVQRDATLVSSATVQKDELQSGDDGDYDPIGIGEIPKEEALPESVVQSDTKGVPVSEKFECDDPSCEVCEWLDRHLKTTTLDESTMTSVVEELSRTIEVENEGGKESNEGARPKGGIGGDQDRVDVRTDAAAAVVSSSIAAHKDATQNEVGGGSGGDLVHAASGRMPGGRAGDRGEGVAEEPSAGEAPRAGTTTRRRRESSEFANALERDISRRDEDRVGGSDGGRRGADRGQECEREREREGDSGDGRREKEKKKSIASDKKEVGDNCVAEETEAEAAAEEGEEGKRSESNRNGDAPFRDEGRGGGGKAGEMRRGDKRERRAVQIVVDEAEEDDGVNLLSKASASLSVSMPEIGDRNRLSAGVSNSRNRDEAGNKKSQRRPPPPQIQIALPQSVDQHLLEQCQRETNMSRLSSSLGRM